MAEGNIYLQAMGAFTDPRSMQRSLPPVMDFVEMYMRGEKPYPVQGTLLKIMFLDTEHMTEFDHFIIREWQRSTENGGEVVIPLDIYERIDWCKRHGYQNFNTFIYCGGRRGGKGFIGGQAACYKLAQLLSYGAPQRHYGIAEGKDIYVDILATQYSQARGMLYNDIRDAILANDWMSQYVFKSSNADTVLQSFGDRLREEKIRAQGKKFGNRQLARTSIATIHVEPHASDSASIRGRASICQMFDEFAHGLDTGSSQSSSQVYDAATPSVLQFGGDGLIYIPSSPWSKAGKFYELYQDAFLQDADGRSENPHMFAIRIPSWWPYYYWEYDPRKRGAIILPPDKSRETRAKELENPEKFDVEFRANFAENENPYMRADVIESLFEPYPKVGDNHNHLSDTGMFMVPYRAHADAGRSQDNFCLAIGHTERMEDGHNHVFIDLMQTWQPSDYENHMLDYTEILDWIRDRLKVFNVTRYTMDQWNSGLFIDSLRKDAVTGTLLNPSMDIDVDTHTGAANDKRWEAFKTACYQGWVHIPCKIERFNRTGTECCIVEEELKAMVVLNGNKVGWDKNAKVSHGDMVDCISTVVVDLLSDQLAMGVGDIGAVVGAAQGGYNVEQGGVGGYERGIMVAGDDYMRSMGYY